MVCVIMGKWELNSSREPEKCLQNRRYEDSIFDPLVLETGLIHILKQEPV